MQWLGAIIMSLYMESLTEIPIERTWCEYLNPCPYGETEINNSIESPKMVGSFECVEECPFCKGRITYADGSELGVLCSNPKNL